MTNYQGHRALEHRQIVNVDGSGEDAREADVIVVGTGAAGHLTALAAASEGCEVIMLEASDSIGGTTWRSSGGYWVPNNRPQREAGIVMQRESTLKHMASLSYPELFDPEAEHLGLPKRAYDLITLYYEQAPKVIDWLEDNGIMGSIAMDWPLCENKMPAYYVTEYDRSDMAILGAVIDDAAGERTAKPNPNTEIQRRLGSVQGDGADMIRSLSMGAKRLGVRTLLDHRVERIVRDDGGEVVGVDVALEDGPVFFAARRGVVFATGGFSHNKELTSRYLRGPIVGSCSAETSQGDFIGLGLEVGAELGNMTEAWWTELPIELVKEMRQQPDLIAFLPGASSILVNASGQRIVNEKLMYNERGKKHFALDENGDMPNRLLFFVWDDAVAQDTFEWPCRWPIPLAGEDAPFVIKGDTLSELGAAIEQRLMEIADSTDGFTLRPVFVEGLTASIERFNGFARTGVDEDFGRGTGSNRQFDAPREDLPNNCMEALRPQGPYYAMILGAATLDTKGGPQVDVHARVLAAGEQPIPGLYGAGNCIASPAASAYWGGGSTLGPAMVMGYIAGTSVAARKPRSVSRSVTA